MKELNVIIVEKDPLNLKSINSTLARNYQHSMVPTVAPSVKDAYKFIEENEYDLIFVDIDIKKDDISNLLGEITSRLHDEELIVVSQNKDHAFESFRYSAIDYIMKPLCIEDIDNAMEKAKRNIELKILLNEKAGITSFEKPKRIVAVPSLTEVKILNVKDIIYLQSDGRYTVFHTINNHSVVSSKNLGHYEKLLIHNSFFRIHHSYLVNVDFALNVCKKGGAYLEVLDKKYLPISKRKADAFYRFLDM
ncbi:LytR/AlgR family response regulator transcription factor [Abyssalbus ytuae]|uniref:LytTR family DNA-binding domain-containing protein n=1 Tax=Abyssalbus ytuae TaxID=2926907 RepID=A0A9E6ZMB0_9FLAO|nr:LytTR family DNA-binding domain-containing protein [Abyssalbus ytuae]UOB18437.1 LytTR family DNA-binding domain-containing protein [Abyssalbus ytuae]